MLARIFSPTVRDIATRALKTALQTFLAVAVVNGGIGDLRTATYAAIAAALSVIQNSISVSEKDNAASPMSQ